jgi:hypothetical protein
MRWNDWELSFEQPGFFSLINLNSFLKIDLESKMKRIQIFFNVFLIWEEKREKCW